MILKKDGRGCGVEKEEACSDEVSNQQTDDWKTDKIRVVTGWIIKWSSPVKQNLKKYNK